MEREPKAREPDDGMAGARLIYLNEWKRLHGRYLFSRSEAGLEHPSQGGAVDDGPSADNDNDDIS